MTLPLYSGRIKALSIRFLHCPLSQNISGMRKSLFEKLLGRRTFFNAFLAGVYLQVYWASIALFAVFQAELE